MNQKQKWSLIENNLIGLFGKEDGLKTKIVLEKIVNSSQRRGTKISVTNEVALITYANTVKENEEKTLKTLNKFMDKYGLFDSFSVLHILPFYPWDTDRGFSVMDYYKIDEDYGDWNEVREMDKRIKVMVDFVVNHASIRNKLVTGALIARHISKDDKEWEEYGQYENFVIAYDDNNLPAPVALSALVRPRPSPVLTRYTVYRKNGVILANLGEIGEGEILGKGWVWTTFSRPKDSQGAEETRQVDLNFANPRVLVEVIKIILFYLTSGASWIRLDAIGYIWKKLGSVSIHEPETHLVLEIIYMIVEMIEGKAVLIAEINEPQDKALTYLGNDQRRQSDMVYQFAHFPLAVEAILSGDGSNYRKWLATLAEVKGRQFVTVLGSHDGMGLKPVKGILSEEKIDNLIQKLVTEYGALPNYSMLPGGKKIVYELCSTPWCLVNSGKQSFEVEMRRYLVVLALGLMVEGVPAIYFNGLIGAKNYLPKSGLDENRTVNREMFDFVKLTEELDSLDSIKGRVQMEVVKLIKIRRQEPLFDIGGGKRGVIETVDREIVVIRVKNGERKLWGLVNVSAEEKVVELDDFEGGVDLISGERYEGKRVKIGDYGIRWLKNERQDCGS